MKNFILLLALSFLAMTGNAQTDFVKNDLLLQYGTMAQNSEDPFLSLDDLKVWIKGNMPIEVFLKSDNSLIRIVSNEVTFGKQMQDLVSEKGEGDQINDKMKKLILEKASPGDIIYIEAHVQTSKSLEKLQLAFRIK